MDRSDLLCRLRVLSNEYNWRQLGVASSTALISEDNVFCKPCNTNEACACCAPDNENTYNSQNGCDQVDSPIPVLTSRKGRRAVVIDSDEEDQLMNSPLCNKPVPNQRQTPVILSDSSDKEEVLRVPASARSKSKHIILSDSEEETPSGPHTARPINTNSISKRIFDEEDTDSNILDAESIEEGVDQVLSVDGSEDELSDHDDWIVNTSEEEEDGSVDSDLSNSDDSFYDFTHRDKENQSNNINVSVPRVKLPSATPRKAHFVDLRDSPQSPPLRKTPAKTANKTTSKGTERKNSAITPKSNKKVEIAFTPVRKMSQIALNAQRVDALSTGKKKFKTVCTQLAQDLYHMYNEIIFNNQLPVDLPVVWSKRLLTTAGICRCRKVSVCGVTQRTASIELSTKVLDDEARLKSTLVHEMCHAANHLIDQLDDAHHGKEFKKWGKRATKQFPEMSVTTCHNYTVHMPHKFKCTNSTCGVVYSRHTKKGINLDKQRCGVCRGELAYQGIADKDGNIAKPRPATGFSVYVKEHFARVRAELSAQLGGSVQGTTVVMRELAVQYKAQKDNNSGTSTTIDTTATSANNNAKRAIVDLTYNESGDEHSSVYSSGYNNTRSGEYMYGEVEVLEVSDTDIDILQNNMHTLVL